MSIDKYIDTINNSIYTLEQLKSAYYVALAGDIERRGFEQWLRDMYQPVYDINLNFLGYENVT